MKIGDLVKIKKKIMRDNGYGIVIAMHWSGDTSMVSVILNGDTTAWPFYKYELEVINGNTKTGNTIREDYKKNTCLK